MNRLLQRLAVFLLALLLVGCTATGSPVAANAPSVSPSPTATAAPTPTPAPFGSRLNPFLFGTAYPIWTEIPGVMKADATIALTQVLRGQEVWDLFLTANQFNDAPAPGKEYLLAEFTIECKDIESYTDQPANYSQYGFRYSSSDFSVIDRPVLVYPEEYPALNLTLYAGASGSGWVCFEVDQQEIMPYAVLDSSIWFLLTEGVPAAPEIAPELTAFLAQADEKVKAFFEDDDMEVHTNYNDDGYFIMFTALEGLAETLALTPEKIRSSWTDYVNAFLDFNRDCYAAFEAAGYGDIAVSCILISDADPNDMLFSSRNGVIVYNALPLDPTGTLPTAETLQPIVNWLQTAKVKGRYDSEARKYKPTEIEDEELRFLATYFYYCISGEAEAALALFGEEVDLIEVERGNLDMELCHPDTLVIMDGNITLLVKDPSGELISFGVYYNDLAKAPEMLADLT